MAVEYAENLETQHIRKLIRDCLERCSASSLKEIVSNVGMSARTVESELRRMVVTGQVEILRPFSEYDAGADDTAENGAKEYFRLIKDTDYSYEWEQEGMVRLPAGRMFDVMQREFEQERRAGKRINFTTCGERELKPSMGFLRV